jgi:hypothetical protein
VVFPISWRRVHGSIAGSCNAMLGLGPAWVELVALSGYAILGAAALSITHAWAAASSPNRLRYVLAWGICTVALALPVFIALGFPGGFAFAHSNVGWTAIPLAALTAAAAIGFARRRRPAATLHGLAFPSRVRRLLPVHFAAVIILGAVDILILCVVFLGNIH